MKKIIDLEEKVYLLRGISTLIYDHGIVASQHGKHKYEEYVAFFCRNQ